jgi:hypothetical protein
MIASHAFKLRRHKLNGPIPPTIAAAVLALDRWVSFGLLETVVIVLAFRRSPSAPTKWLFAIGRMPARSVGELDIDATGRTAANTPIT